MTMDDSRTPQSQDSTANHANPPNDRGALSNRVARDRNPPPNEHNGTQQNSNQPPWWREIHIWIQLAIFVVGCYVAYIYSGQLKAMLKANEIESRPYIGIEVKDSEIVFEPITKVKVVFHNSGKLPAYADLFWSLAYSKERSYSPNILPHNSREELLSPSPVEYPIDDVLSGDVPAKTPKAQSEAIQGMHNVGGFIYVWAQGRYGRTSEEARIGKKYDTAICNEYTLSPGPIPTIQRIAPCPWENTNYAK
jgi:hypothetical protein